MLRIESQINRIEKNVVGGEKFSQFGILEGSEDLTGKGKEIGRANFPL